MRDALTISAFAKRSGVPSKTIRYWEGLGLLPKAARSHTGYRVFDPAALRYVSFVQKSKAIGLTLAEMQEVLHLTRSGRCPCPEVFGWTQAKAKSVAEQIRELSALLRRLKRIEREWKRCSCEGDKEEKTMRKIWFTTAAVAASNTNEVNDPCCPGCPPCPHPCCPPSGE